MPLPPGTRLGQYDVIAPLGVGGMGEVYRARDARLGREVALKLLPASFAQDPDRLMRFEREAKTLAALNHPNIAAIYGTAESTEPSAQALVMELVEGEDLSQRIARGALALDDALPIAQQIAAALETAHEAGIIHRDLKPANIKVREDGTVKVLDFGLAKASGLAGPAGSGADGMNSPTMTSPALTAMGLILGTAAYMAPEQAKGRPVDRRADVWAFGVVLFEMLTGTRVFEGGDITEVLASVLKDAPSHESLPANTPQAIRRLLRRCLEKNPANRLDSMAAARLEIEEARREPALAAGVAALPTAAAPAPVWRRVMPWAVAALAIAVAGSIAWRAPAPAVARLSISLPDGHQVTSGPVISRDGRLIVFASAAGNERPRLYLRTLDSFELRVLPGTEDASRPFLSPDGRWVGFFAQGRLFKLDLEGGAPSPLADAPSPSGGTWAEDGTIVFVPTWNGGLHRISGNGGRSDVLIAPDPAKKEYAYTAPLFLPGGRSLLFSIWGATFTVERLSLPDLQREAVAPGFWTTTVYTTTGHVLTGSNEGDIKALPYPPSGSDGPPVSVLDRVHWSGGSGDGLVKLSVSDAGTLVYAPGDITQRSLVLVDETGGQVPVPSEPQPYLLVALSPDGSRVASDRDGELWLVDLERGGRSPLWPRGRSGAQSAPVWSRDSSRVFFAANPEGNWEIYAASAAGTGNADVVLRKELDQFPLSVAQDGTMLFGEVRPGAGMDLWLLPPGGQPVAWLATAADETEGAFSPDGRLVAFSSNTSGRTEVYVRAREGADNRVQISTNGGAEPVWAPQGDRLFYREQNALMVVEVARSGQPLGRPRRLFDQGWQLPSGVGFGVMPDGKRFLMVRFAPEAIPTRLDVVFNWFAELKARVK